MSGYMSKFSVLFALLVSSYFTISIQEDPVYVPPSSAQYPFGDEVLNDDLNETHVQEEFAPVDVESIQDIYTFCPNITEDEEEESSLYSESECHKCDVRARYDKDGAVVECFGCIDINSLAESREGPNVMFLVYHLEIPSYANPDPD